MGNLLLILRSQERLKRYFRGVLIGLPVWYVIGILILFANDFATAFGIPVGGIISTSPQPSCCRYGPAFGDMGAGSACQLPESRKDALYFLFNPDRLPGFVLRIERRGSSTRMYLLCMGLGFPEPASRSVYHNER